MQEQLTRLRESLQHLEPSQASIERILNKVQRNEQELSAVIAGVFSWSIPPSVVVEGGAAVGGDPPASARPLIPAEFQGRAVELLLEFEEED